MMPYVEAMLIMAPRGRRTRCGIAALAHKKVPRRLTAIVRSQASMSSSCRRLDPPEIPASLTSTSSRPKSATAVLIRAATCSASATSHALKDALPPALRISSTVRCPSSTFVSPMATVAPAAAMSRAMARPIPVAPPVRSTTRSFREGISPCLLVLVVKRLVGGAGFAPRLQSVKQDGQVTASGQRRRARLTAPGLGRVDDAADQRDEVGLGHVTAHPPGRGGPVEQLVADVSQPVLEFRGAGQRVVRGGGYRRDRGVGQHCLD